MVAVTIHEARERKKNLAWCTTLSFPFIRLVNLETGVNITRSDLSEDYSTETAMVFSEVFRHGFEWKFKAVGQGYAGGLCAMAIHHGVDVL